MLNLDAELRFHALLEQALACEGAEREAFLVSLVDEDPELVAELRICLEDDDDDLMGGFLEQPAVDPAEIATAASLIAPGSAKTPTQHVPRPRRGPAPEDWQVKLKAPKQVGPYEPIEPVGSGGMGKVYTARRSAEPRQGASTTVALKVLRGSLPEGLARRRFAADVDRLSHLSHPNLAAILDGGISDGGHPYYGMEWVEGPNIMRYCRLHRCSLAARIELALQVCRGMEYAHGQETHHLGLKPSNILLATVAGEAVAKVTDIGIAGALADSLTESAVLTRGGLDTALYVSPEAIDSSRGEVDAGSDIYALGILLFELTVGVLPVDTRQANLMQVVQTVLHEETPPASVRWQGLDPALQHTLAQERATTPEALAARLAGPLEDVLRRATSKDKAGRPRDITQLRRRLEALSEG